MEIRLHQFGYQVYLLKKVHVWRLKLQRTYKHYVPSYRGHSKLQPPKKYLVSKLHHNITCKMSRHDNTFSCLKNIIILSSRKTRFELTKLWKTLGSFLRATRFPSRGSVTDQTTPNAPYPIGRSGWQSAVLVELFPKNKKNVILAQNCECLL